MGIDVQKTRLVTFRATVEQHEELKARARREGMTLTAYLLCLGLGELKIERPVRGFEEPREPEVPSVPPSEPSKKSAWDTDYEAEALAAGFTKCKHGNFMCKICH